MGGYIVKKYLRYISSGLFISLITVLNIGCSKEQSEDVGLVYGEVSAPVVIENYTSFQCPDCSELHLKLYEVLKKYIDSGDVKYVEKQIDIERFQFDDLIYKRMNDDQINDFDKLSEIYEKQYEWLVYDNDEDVIELLNLTDIDNEKNISDLKKIKKEKEKLDIHAVPTVYINGEEMSNKITAEKFEEKIESLLK